MKKRALTGHSSDRIHRSLHSQNQWPGHRLGTSQRQHGRTGPDQQ